MQKSKAYKKAATAKSNEILDLVRKTKGYSWADVNLAMKLKTASPTDKQEPEEGEKGVDHEP